jgi:uncharacterized protein YdeI (YjbR/CyaY-like superfamily)
MSDPETPSRLKRAIHEMPGDVRAEPERAGLMGAYESRPPYQRNDYIGWISRAKRDATRQKRLRQMLDELRCGDVYMNMDWRPYRG